MARCERCAELEHDNAELRRAVERLERQHASCAHVGDELPVASALLDVDGGVVECNAELPALLGLDRSQAAGLELASMMAVPQHAQRLREHLIQVFGTRQRQVCDLWLRRPDGGITPVRMHSAYVGGAPSPRCRSVLVEVGPTGGPATGAPRERASSYPPPPNGADGAEPHGNGSGAGERRRESATVLVVEDESLVRKAVQHYLDAAGYRVLAASDRPGALQCCASEAIDLVLTDLSLADGATGPEIVERVKERWPRIGVLYMTACPPELLARRGFSVPVGDTLEKPFSKEKLLSRVAKALGARAGR